MAQSYRFPRLAGLTKQLTEVSPLQRLAIRQRLEAIAHRRTSFLIDKYGETAALGVCRNKLVFCVKHAPGIREHIWIRVYHNLRPREHRTPERWYRG